MSIRNLDSLFSPSSVAVFGASDRPASVGATVWRNLLTSGFQGPVYAVTTRYQSLGGKPVFANAAALPGAPDLALICTPPATVPGLVAQLGQLGTRAAIILSAGLDAAQTQSMLAAARPHLLRILGPNCIGLQVPQVGLNASFAQAAAQPGELAFVTQSGALLTAMLDWTDTLGIGFSHLVSLGEHADVDFGDVLDYLASDAHTRAILLYIESVDAPRKFMSAARAAARNKPVIVVKAGRSLQGQRAAASHTGAMAGSDMVYEAAIARAGMLRVDTLQDLFLAAQTLARFGSNRSDQLTVLTNGGGAGVMAADAAAHAGIALAELSATTIAQLDAVLPANWSHANPVDIIGDAPAQRYVEALKAINQDPAAGAVLFIHAPTAIVASADIARALLPLATQSPPRLLACWLGGTAVAQARQSFQDAGVACFDTPEQAVRAFAMGLAYRRNQEQLMQTPPAAAARLPADRAGAQALIDTTLASGRTLMTEPEAKALLSAYRIETVATRTAAATAVAAIAEATQVGYPVALKILSADISHKSEVGGVALNLASAQEVRLAAQAMLARVRQARPGARIDGFTVQAMVRRAHTQELIVGAAIDPAFGPVILFGQGGTAVELLADRALALPPLNLALARALVERTRVSRLLKGWRDVPAADLDALYEVLVTVSQMLADLPQISELDINPLILNHQGALALDARVGLKVSAPAGAANFAIRPYPLDLVQTLPWQGRLLTLRPIRPEDEFQHRQFLGQLDAEDIRMRVFYSRRSIGHGELARLTQIDYEREMAFVAVACDPDPANAAEQTLGVVRAVADPDNIDAEFGIIVRSDIKGLGLGALLLRKMVDYLRARGTRRLVATVLGNNQRMRELARQLEFQDHASPSDPDTRSIHLDLQAPPARP